MKQRSEALDLRQILGILRRRLPVIALCALVVAGAAFLFSKQETKKYVATASVVFNDNEQLSQEISGISAGGSFESRLAQQATDLELLQTGDMAAKTAGLLGHGLTAQQVSESLSVAGKGESGVFDVSVTAASPSLTAKIANTYVHLFAEKQARTTRRTYKSVLALIEKQLAELSPTQRAGADGLALQTRAQTLSILSELKQGDVTVAGEAAVPTSPSSPKTFKNTIIGGVLGLFIGFALAFILESLDRRIRAPEDLEEIYGLPLLGGVPRSKALARNATTLPPADTEAFGLIRAHLRLLNTDRSMHTVAIMSAAAGDGKTTIAHRLAEVAGKAGSRVLLLELDLRHPTLAERLNVPTGPGAANVLVGDVSLGDAIRSIPLEETLSGDSARGKALFDVLVAGAALPPNPTVLLESQAMESVLAYAKSTYDLILIDMPPLTCVSDGFPLLTKVDGVVIVGRIEHSRRQDAERLREILSNSQVPLLGVIANNSKSAGSGRHQRGKELSSVVGPTDDALVSEPLVSAGRI